MSAYNWTLSRQVAERFAQFRNRERQKFIDHLNQLADDPHLPGESTFLGPDGTRYEISSFQSRAVTYHVDHAVETVNVIAVE